MITSPSNPLIKEIRKLRDRKHRQESGLFFIEGIRIVLEAINNGAAIQKLIVAPELIRTNQLREEIQKAVNLGLQSEEVSSEVFNSISLKDGPQGIGALVSQNWTDQNRLSQPLKGFWVALYQVADPGNLGSILRTLDGVGGEGLILVGRCTDPYDPTALRASMGAIFSKEIIRIDERVFINMVNENKIELVGTSDSASDSYRECKYKNDMILLMGSEREGLPLELQTVCERIVSIPMKGSSDSLNLAVAASIVMYEISYQQQRKIK